MNILFLLHHILVIITLLNYIYTYLWTRPKMMPLINDISMSSSVQSSVLSVSQNIHTQSPPLNRISISSVRIVILWSLIKTPVGQNQNENPLILRIFPRICCRLFEATIYGSQIQIRIHEYRNRYRTDSQPVSALLMTKI